MKMKCKIWNVTRTVKKMIMTDFDDGEDLLKEVLDKGAAKCNLDPSQVRLVLEKDGTDIDETEVLLECLKETDTFIILSGHENWYPAVYDIPTRCDLFPSGPLAPEPYPMLQDKCSPNAEMFELEPSSPITLGPEGDIQSAGTTGSAHEGLPLCTGREKVTQATPLPHFSDFVATHLQKNQPMLVWSRIIHQSAEYYLVHFPEMSDPSEYQAVGEKLYSLYPSIKQEGKYPWTMFCKDLSQRIRWLRWSRKKKSATNPSTIQDPNPKTFKLVHDQNQPESSLQDYESNVLELKKETTKRNINSTTVKALITETHEMRASWIRSQPDGRISPILDKFPVFEFGNYIMMEFELLMGGKDALQTFNLRLEQLSIAVENLMGKKLAGEMRMLSVLRFVEGSVRFDKSKGQRSQSIITEEKNIPDEEKASLLLTKREEAPELVLFTADDSFVEATIVADEVSFITQTTTVSEAIILLLAVYYIFHLSYPRTYCQLLGLLQEYLLHEPYPGLKSKKYKLFSGKLNAILF